MKTLPNGLTVFNATPHPITFWQEGWEEPVTVEPDEVINARPVEEFVARRAVKRPVPVQTEDGERLVRASYALFRTRFVGDERGEEIARRALEAGADVVVGSIIAAQAYPGLVVAMVPAPGFERVPPSEKRMRPDKFTVF